jgi:(p)ppGpp synthase/HD superfamily hydrolase
MLSLHEKNVSKERKMYTEANEKTSRKASAQHGQLNNLPRKVTLMKISLDQTYRQLLEAASFAARAHQGQYRKDRVTPYVSHPFRVCLVVRDIFGCDDSRMLITALLHDAIEDTLTDYDDLEERYGPEIATWVAYLTKDKRLPEKERERVYLQRLIEAPWQVQVCKLADIFDNLMDIAHLPSDRQAHSRKRAELYFAQLRRLSAPEAKKPITLVQQLIEEMRVKVPS